MATFRKLPSGNWQARVMIDGKYKPIGTFNSKKEAEIKANEIENKIYYGESIDDREMTFKKLHESWLEHKMINVEKSTYNNLYPISNAHMLSFFGNKKIKDIRRSDIRRWNNKLASQRKKDGTSKYMYSTRKRYLTILSDIFNYAVYELEVLSTNPCFKITVPKKDVTQKMKTKQKKKKHYSLDELNALLKFLENFTPHKHKEYNLFYVLSFFLSRTGLRINEALALTWNDLNGEMLTIDKQVYVNEDNEVEIVSLKNDSSYREIKIDEETIELLKEFKRTQNKVILKYKTFVKSQKDIIFQNNLGDYLKANGVRDNYEIYCEKAGVEYKGTHVFRHTHAVLLLEAGASLDYVSKRLGHKSIKTTADEYSDITPKRDELELDKLSNYMARSWHDNEEQKSE